MNKKELRSVYIKRRDMISEDDVKSMSQAIANNLYDLDLYKNSNFIMSYVNFRSEVITEEIIRNSLNSGKKIGVPISITKTKELLISELKDYDNELELGVYNILTPKKEYIREVEPSKIDLVLVPGVAFDRQGYRIGYGGGYYDRFLNKLNDSAVTIALAFSVQLIEEVPKGEYDLPIDYILTEKGLIHCN
ncbi:5-formyltetrahydrofolate cyclo-ligase [Anaerosalibacter sp. Marseille-P3206]|uniref:5-formyltetrahydrofolate cyclo-ligase n=1 Tax=Anaerosalibacter sp. Marseille-P3206 TaxID=1871005 RepID=UPI0009844B4A|nr:5-formyltetrahydrofolate cyclo-ligase [Anaerosalibacter sp. Marseille-P3206]